MLLEGVEHASFSSTERGDVAKPTECSECKLITPVLAGAACQPKIESRSQLTAVCGMITMHVTKHDVNAHTCRVSPCAFNLKRARILQTFLNKST